MRPIHLLLPLAVLSLLALACSAPAAKAGPAPRIWEDEPYANTNGSGG